MKRLMLVCVMIMCLCLCLTASADHSVLPKEGDMNETEALNCAVNLLCDERNLTEEDVRGDWYYYAMYYKSSNFMHYDDYNGSIWLVEMVDPEIIGETTGTIVPYWIHTKTEYYLRADTGELLSIGNEYFEEDMEVWENKEDSLDWRLPLVPTLNQVQPAEAILMAQDILSETVGAGNIDGWQDYNLIALTDQGRFWYRIVLGHGNIENNWPLTLTIWIDAKTREIIWHSDTDRLAFRYEIYRTAGSWTAWYNEQLASREEEWGPSNTWDYRQHAAFEEECGGIVYWPERLYGLPGDTDISYEAARDAAIAWLNSEEGPSWEWHLIGSWFHDNENAWIDDMMSDGIPPEGNRYWEIGVEGTESELIRFGIMVNPVTGVVDGTIGW